MGQPNYVNGFSVTLQEQMLELPLKWKKPQMIFVNSMSDLFHEDVPEEFIYQVFDIMQQTPWHSYQILTKRGERLQELSPQLPWNDNIWMGVTVESAKYVGRIDNLRLTGAKIKFVSFEPLLSEITDLDLRGINWAIVGGESGPGARPMEEEWVLEIRQQCSENNVPFFFKQWGGTNKKKAGRLLEGRTWDGIPQLTAL